jgi:N-acetylmuramoyl-L-alanine amidase
MRSIHTLVIHCTATPEGRDVDVKTIRMWHTRDNGWKDIGYHYVVYRDGSVHAGRPVEQVGAHVAGHNSGSIGVVYVGGVDASMKPKDTRTPEQKVALRKLLTELVKTYKITTLVGHRDFDKGKACPSFDAKNEYADILKGGSK